MIENDCLRQSKNQRGESFIVEFIEAKIIFNVSGWARAGFSGLRPILTFAQHAGWWSVGAFVVGTKMLSLINMKFRFSLRFVESTPFVEIANVLPAYAASEPVTRDLSNISDLR